MGNQYRISRNDLEAFTGGPLGDKARAPLQGLEVSSIVQAEGIDGVTANRVSNLLMAAAQSRHEVQLLRVDTLFDEERSRLKIMIIGSIESTTVIIDMVRRLIEE